MAAYCLARGEAEARLAAYRLATFYVRQTLGEYRVRGERFPRVTLVMPVWPEEGLLMPLKG